MDQYSNVGCMWRSTLLVLNEKINTQGKFQIKQPKMLTSYWCTHGRESAVDFDDQSKQLSKLRAKFVLQCTAPFLHLNRSMATQPYSMQ